MKTTAKTGGDRLPCGMVSLKMFHIPHSKALIIAYLNLRSGLKNYTFNQTDISNQTNIGKTVVRQCVNELADEGVLNRIGKSFYRLDRQKMESLYYNASDSDLNASESDACSSETDANPSESDTDASESDAIHSSSLHSRESDSSELHSRGLHHTATTAAQVSELPKIIPTVSGLGREPLQEAIVSVSGLTASVTTPATDPKRRPNDSESPKGENHSQPSLTVPSIEGPATGSIGSNAIERFSGDPELWACWCKVWAVHKAGFDGLADERKPQIKAAMWELTQTECENSKRFDRSFIPDSILDNAKWAVGRKSKAN